METLLACQAVPDVIVSNVAYSKVVRDLSDLKWSSLSLSLSYSSWPLISLVQHCRDVCGRYPQYVLGVSNDGPDIVYPGYDIAAMGKALIETAARYLSVRLRSEGVRVNVLRLGMMNTASLQATFGQALTDKLCQNHADKFLDLRAAARVCVALCSGLMDAVTGQTITVDGGSGHVSFLNTLLDAEAKQEREPL
jgi:enoyl-[acyl-carrier-protein] reductase (NADH)